MTAPSILTRASSTMVLVAAVLGAQVVGATEPAAPASAHLHFPSEAMGLYIPVAFMSGGGAGTDPTDDPCGLAAALFCKLLPIAPDLDGDVDLTTQMPPGDPVAQPPDSLPPSEACVAGCG